MLDVLHGELPAPTAASSDTTEDRLVARLRVARAHGAGPRTLRLLTEGLGGLEPLLAADAAALAEAGAPPRIIAALLDRTLEASARPELARLRGGGARLLGLGLPGYPAMLAAIHDPPMTLAVHGALAPEGTPTVAIVGARRATPTGLEIARTLGHDLAIAGVSVVSGLARGIDQAAHEGALAAGGHTVAVLGSGVFQIYPPSGRGLAERIVARGGAIVSEAEPDAPPLRHSFPQRNRIIAGLSIGVCVVEAGPRSGSLITADLAQGEGRDLFAVPGSILEPLSRGPNRLLRDGARLVECAADILDEVLGVAVRDRGPDDAVAPEHTEEDRPPGPSLDAEARRVRDALDPHDPRTLERLARETGLPIDAVMRALGRLELTRQVRSVPGGHVRRT